jgi:hypothetical protein
MTFSISALVLTRDSYIKPDSEAGGLIWVEGWYQGPYGKFIWKFWKKGGSREKGEEETKSMPHAPVTSLYRSTLFGIFLKLDSKQKYLQVEQRNTCILCPHFFDWYSIREKVCNSIFIFRTISLTLVGKPQCFFYTFYQMVVVPFLRNNPSADMFFQRFIFPAKTLWEKYSDFSLQVIHS